MIVALITFAILLAGYGAILWLTRVGGPADVVAFWDDDNAQRHCAAQTPSREAPGAPPGAGDAGKRDGERDAPILPGDGSTAGRAGRPRSFSGVSR